MRLVLVADTHRLHRTVTVPDGDVLVHAGDFCGRGRPEEAREFARYFLALPHRHKVVIAGNHDRCLEDDPDLGAALFPGCHYLLDGGVEIEGVSFWGSPWQPWFCDWAFNLPRGPALREKWEAIPGGVDVLVTHGPPRGILDRTIAGEHVGCDDLLEAVGRVRPRVHVFGHIHEAYGEDERDGTRFVNASVCTFGYEPRNAPVVVDI